MFLWAFLDEGITNASLGGMDVKGQSAPDGVVGPFRQKEAGYYSCKAIFSPIQIAAPDPTEFSGTLAVSNDFDFTDLNQCAFQWQLGWFSDPADPANYFSTNALTGGLLVGAASGDFSVPSIAPGADGLLTLTSFPSNWTNFDALRLTATDPAGNNIYTWTWPLHTQLQIQERVIGQASPGAPIILAGTDATRNHPDQWPASVSF